MREIKKNMMIGEAISINPRVADILIGQGIHCIGCSGVAFETLEQGMKAHGISNKGVNDVIKKINKPGHLEIAKNAESKIKDMLGKKYAYLKIKEKNGKLRLSLEKKKNSDDCEIKENGIKILYSKKNAAKIKSLKIDYSDAKGGFVIK